MPIYEFRCPDCNHRFAKLCSMGEAGSNLICPSCQQASPIRVMSGFTLNNPGSLRGTRGDGCTSCTSRNCSACKH